MDEKQGLPIIQFASQQEWEAWLEAHHGTSKGLWLKIAKKESTLESRNRYAILYRIQDAKRPETRARRIEQFIAMLDEHKKVYP
jgi:uncharacterized protein YdeI (YjbR/CyaY-like superfamily)